MTSYIFKRKTESTIEYTSSFIYFQYHIMGIKESQSMFGSKSCSGYIPQANSQLLQQINGKLTWKGPVSALKPA